MLGHDVRVILDADGIARIIGLISDPADPLGSARLQSEMNAMDPERARALLEAMLGGLLEERGSHSR